MPKWSKYRRYLILASALAIIGFLFSMPSFILWLNNLNPIEGLLFYQAITLGAVLGLAKVGLVIHNTKIRVGRQALGLYMVLFAFLIITDFTSCWINIITAGTCPASANIFTQSEDGATFFLWSSIVNNPATARILTFVVTPIILVLIGGYLIGYKRPELN